MFILPICPKYKNYLSSIPKKKSTINKKFQKFWNLIYFYYLFTLIFFKPLVLKEYQFIVADFGLSSGRVKASTIPRIGSKLITFIATGKPKLSAILPLLLPQWSPFLQQSLVKDLKPNLNYLASASAQKPRW